MLKRKATDEGGAAEPPTQPIPRNLPQKSVTLHFTNRTWEEFAPGVLYYDPVCQNPFYMMDLNMIKQFMKFRGLWETMEISTPVAKLSNLIFLQDDLRVQSNTPTDATAFTQVCYLMHYNPAAQTEYFRLDDVMQYGNNTVTKPLTYNLLSGQNTKSQFIKVGETSFTDFENLAIIPAKINETAGWVPGKAFADAKNNYNIDDPYIPPSPITQEPFYTLSKKYSANMNVDPDDHYYMEPNTHLLWARNQDKVCFYKYGDTIELPKTTNLEGVQLMNTRANDFTNQYSEAVSIGGTRVEYLTEFLYPGNNRPFKCRCTNLDPYLGCSLHNKGFKPLQHHFIMMPPIRKPNGALLGQRCSALMEQSMSVTFHFHESTFATGEDQTNMMAQKHGAVIRRAIYGQTTTEPAEPAWNGGPLCPYGMICEEVQGDKLCKYKNSFRGLFTFAYDLPKATREGCFIEHETKPDDATEANTYRVLGNEIARGCSLNDLFPNISPAMQNVLTDHFVFPFNSMYIYIPAQNLLEIAGKFVATVFESQLFPDLPPIFLNLYEAAKDIWLQINTNALDAIIKTKIKCEQGNRTDNVKSKTTNVSIFFK
uniref:VP1 n=1 Tax=Phylloscopus fuscatus densovirus TaxID=2794500 RepID=A0A8A4XE08_9VIRU|nr:MAG: VP1 [Phylloscopus fuscatus densovirus]